jgi:ketosteroid isomerase-like protein
MKLFLTLFFTLFTTIFSQANFKTTTAETEKIAQSYFTNYMNLDFDANTVLMHDSISFADPTAKLIFGGKYVEGKAAVLANFKSAYASITKMSYKLNRTMISSYTAVYEIDLHWEFKSGPAGKLIKIDMPLVVILTIKDGKIFSHRDYGDYTYFTKQYGEQSKSQ